MKLIYIKEGLRMYFRSRKVKKKGFKRYSGNAEEICKQIVKDCWNGTFFQTSTGHFSQFYSRDFGWCTKSLLKLGYRDEVRKTLEYALEKFMKHGSITTSITPGGKPFDFPTFGIDSVAFLIHSLALLNDLELVKKYKKFLESQVSRIPRFLDETGLVNKNVHLSSIKDQAIRQSSCYDACMLGMLSQGLNKLNLANPLKNHNYIKLLADTYWTGRYFLDDRSGSKTISSDANIFPFWTGLVKDRMIFRKVLDTLDIKGLTKPFPLKYTAEHENDEHIFASRFSPNYEGNTIWAHLGMIYLEAVKNISRERYQKCKESYAKQIEKHGTFLEVYEPSGEPYKTKTYVTDEGMLWASMFLAN